MWLVSSQSDNRDSLLEFLWTKDSVFCTSFLQTHGLGSVPTAEILNDALFMRYLLTSWSWEWGEEVSDYKLNPINLWHQTDACRWKAVTWNVLVSKAFLPPVPRLILMMTVYYMMPRSESVSNILSIVSDVNWVCIYYPYASGPLFMTPLSWQTINPLDLWARPGCVLISFELSIGSFWMSNEEAMIPSDSPSLSIPGGSMP